MSQNRLSAWRADIAARAKLDRRRASQQAPDRRLDRRFEGIANRQARRAAVAIARGATAY